MVGRTDVHESKIMGSVSVTNENPNVIFTEWHGREVVIMSVEDYASLRDRAERTLDVANDDQWDQLVARPSSARFLDNLLARAKSAAVSGETSSMIEGLQARLNDL